MNKKREDIMKRFWMMMSFAVVFAAGCSRNDEAAVPTTLEQAEEQMLNEVFTATIAEREDSRTMIDDKTGKTIWCEDDLISLFRKNGYHTKMEVISGAETTDISFRGVTTPGEKYHVNTNEPKDMNYAIYPFSEQHLFDAATNCFTVDLSNLAEQQNELTLDDEEQFISASFSCGQAVMVAKSASTDFRFGNALAMLRLRLKPEFAGPVLHKVTVTSKSGLPLAGVATIDMTTDAPVAKFQPGGNSSVLLNFTEDADGDGQSDKDEFGYIKGLPLHDENIGYDFYLLLPAMTFPEKDFMVTIDYEDGQHKKIEKTFKGELTLERNKVKNISLTITDAGFTGIID